ncbi:MULTISPECIES: T9SS type A sorting domain-containing protein [unclassified Dysgonomonas]|jgi:hypothetical protein|uniref:T9SS type A sorting domain-containing protein n=1 Tax=unclassified Dysgonomonas TaxID=2630389 RepID=UPI0025B854E2|nr:MULTISPECIES: T9SS type A sorting domain-containing protein [unclassified Dysgonomonas]MDR2002363.1 T9SS type A sorting domain-containing protein [Prevotella sp.]HMM04995.1 T9SS type A sorting domain-containing protein [Dysgonomonas sp.]
MAKLSDRDILIRKAEAAIILRKRDSGQGTPNATFRASDNEFGTVKATVMYDGVSYQVENSRVWVGPPGYYASTDGETWFPKPICIDKGIGPDNDVYPKLEGIEGNSPLDYKWTQKSNNFQFFHTSVNRAIVQPLSKGDMLFTYSAKNQCGWSVTPQIFQIPAISCSGSGGGLPGEGVPTDGPLKSTATGTPTSTSIKVYSFPTGSLVYKENKAINFDIQNTTLNAGIYILEKTDEEGNVTREKVMKIK